jgi:hypothetical protein
MEQLVHSEHGVPSQHGIDRSGQLLGEEGEGLASAVFFLESSEVLLTCRRVAQTQDGSFGKGPCQGRVTDLGPRGSVPFAGGFLRPGDPTARGDNILPPREALAILHFVEQDQAEELAHPGDGLQAVEGRGIVLLGRLHDRQLQVCQQRVVVADQGQGDLEALWHRRRRKARGDAVPVGFGGDVLAHLGEVVWALSVVDRGQECGPCAHQRHVTSSEVTGGPHLGGRDGGVREQAAAEHHRNLLGIDLVMFGLAAVDSLHREGVSKDKRHACASAEVGEPVPGEAPCDAHDQMLAVGRNGLEKRVRSGWQMPVDKHLSLLVQDAEGHGASLQIDAAVQLVWLRRESPEVSSSFLSDSLPLSAYHGGLLGRGPQ